MFEEIYRSIDYEAVRDRIYSSTPDDVRRSLDRNAHGIDDMIPLFSPGADGFLEKMALMSRDITRMRFGKAIQLYAPLYISNECSSSCLYCGFNAKSKIRRVTLTAQEVREEAEILYRSGFRHILLLTGEKREAVPPEALAGIISDLHRRFPSLSIEVYPMEEEEYRSIVNAGADGLTLYQETYDRTTYAAVHPFGKKSDFFWRLNAPDRGGRAGFRRIGVGALLGLSDWRMDGFFTALHALYLARTYWKSQVLVSFPRLRHAPGGFQPAFTASDRDLTHLICVMRLLMNDAGLVLSTREPQYMRDNLLPLGITMISAGSRTNPGGYSGRDDAGSQFDVEDTRSPSDVAAMIREKGFDPVWKDWDRNFL